MLRRGEYRYVLYLVYFHTSFYFGRHCNLARWFTFRTFGLQASTANPFCPFFKCQKTKDEFQLAHNVDILVAPSGSYFRHELKASESYTHWIFVYCRAHPYSDSEECIVVVVHNHYSVDAAGCVKTRHCVSFLWWWC